ncbi:uncharacterized protein LOC119100357 [Pollicipes pollicipes]|uniref:uncharacterized protein LOC119100357 n=1 Tax=Pollicipes pollicipes TaxID=41117 RepID=UPI0018857C76|nr:uncharacterized protein LOC119100357 [Pollicipes pollicipes]
MPRTTVLYRLRPPRAPPLPTLEVYPTVSPQTVVIPIVSSIIVFPAAALTVICCLRYRARRARRRAKRPRLGDKADRAVPVIRIDGTRRTGLEPKGKWRRRGDDCKQMNELHYTSATV